MNARVGWGFMLAAWLCGCAHAPPVATEAEGVPEAATEIDATRAPSAIPPGDFETRGEDTEFARFLKGLDLNDSRFVYKYKSTGTSIGVRLYSAGKSVGKWAPGNSANNVEAQVVSYALGRYLGMSQLVVPSAYYRAEGRMLSEFRRMTENAVEKNKWRAINRGKLLQELQRRPQSMMGVLTTDTRTAEVESLVDANRNTINSTHPIAGFIRADGPLPSERARMTFAGVKMENGRAPTNDERTLAREFSKIMVLDILCGQWDRWSGGNVEASWSEDGVLHFLARDNGGASIDSSNQVEKYLRIVSRFDRAQIERVRRLGDALTADPDGTAKALQMEAKPDALRGRVRSLLAHVEKQRAAHGDTKVFFP